MANEVVNEGKVTRVIGHVVDIQFDAGELPPLHGAIELTNPTIDDTAANLVLEVVQHIGDTTARCVAMESTGGLQAGQNGVYRGNQRQNVIGTLKF